MGCRRAATAVLLCLLGKRPSAPPYCALPDRMSSPSSKKKRSKGFVSSVGRSKSTEVLAPLEKARTDKDLDVWSDAKLSAILDAAHERYDKGQLEEAQQLCDRIYEVHRGQCDGRPERTAAHAAAPCRTRWTPPGRTTCFSSRPSTSSSGTFQRVCFSPSRPPVSTRPSPRRFLPSVRPTTPPLRCDRPYSGDGHPDRGLWPPLRVVAAGNALKALGDVEAATQAYLKAIQLKVGGPRRNCRRATGVAPSPAPPPPSRATRTCTPTSPLRMRSPGTASRL